LYLFVFNALYSVFDLLYFTVSKWRGEAAVDEFDPNNLSSQSGLDDLSYAGDPRQFVEVDKSFCFIRC